MIAQRSFARDHVNIVAVRSGGRMEGRGGVDGGPWDVGGRGRGHQEMRTGGREKLTRSGGGGGEGGGGSRILKIKSCSLLVCVW